MDRTGYDSNQDVVTLSEVHGEPDLFLFVEPGINFFPRGLENLRCPSACYVIDTHSNLEIRINYARFFDYIFVAQKDHVIFFEKMGFKNVFWLYCVQHQPFVVEYRGRARHELFVRWLHQL